MHQEVFRTIGAQGQCVNLDFQLQGKEMEGTERKYKGKDIAEIREKDKNLHQLSSDHHLVSSMSWLCLCHFSTFFFSHSDDGEPPVTVKGIIFTHARMFPAYEATLCQANKAFGFGFAVFICSGYPCVQSILGNRQLIYLGFLFPSKMRCACLLIRKGASSRKVSHSHPC